MGMCSAINDLSCYIVIIYKMWGERAWTRNLGQFALSPQTLTEQQETRRSKSPSPSPAFMGRKVSNWVSPTVSPHRDPHWPHMGTSHTPTLRNPTQRPLRASHRNLSLGAPEHAPHKCSQDLSIPPLTGPSRRVWCHSTNQQHRGRTSDSALTQPQSSKTSSHCQHCPRWGSLLGERIMLLTLCNHRTWTGESQRSPATGLQKSLLQRSSVAWALPQGFGSHKFSTRVECCQTCNESQISYCLILFVFQSDGAISYFKKFLWG